MTTNTRAARWASALVIVLVFGLVLAATPATAAARTSARAQFRPSPYEGGILTSLFEPRTGRITLASLDERGATPLELPDPTMQPWSPDRYGSRIVFQDARPDGSVIAIYDLSSKKISRIPGEGEDSEPAIWGDTVVFSRITDRGARIFAYDIGTEEARDITPHASAAVSPDIYESTVVYGDKGDVWVTTLDDPDSARRLTDAPGEQGTPAVWADRVVYADWSGGLAHLREHSLKTGRERELVTGARAQMAPALWGSRLAYEDYDYYPPIAHVKVTTLENDRADIGSWIGTRLTTWLDSLKSERNG